MVGRIRPDHGLGVFETEMSAAADIDGDALGQGLEDQRVDGAVGGDEAGGVAGERVGEHVAGIQQRDDLFDDHLRVDGGPSFLRPQRAEMNIDGKAQFAAGLLGELQGFIAPAGETARFGMGLDALDQVRFRRRP